MPEGSKSTSDEQIAKILRFTQSPTVGTALLTSTLNGTQTLDLSNESLCDLDIKNLCAVLKDNKTVTDLNLAGNYIDENDANYIAEMLTKNSTLMKLDLSNNRLGGTGLQILATTIVSISHRDMGKFKLLAHNNGLTNISECEEEKFWNKKVTQQKQRFDYTQSHVARTPPAAVLLQYPPSCTGITKAAATPAALAKIGAKLCISSPLKLGSKTKASV